MATGTWGRAYLARLVRFGVVLGMALLALMASLVVLQVAARNFFDLGLPWADELARFSGIGLVFLAVPCLAGRQVLVSVSMLPDAVGPGLRRGLVLLADLATLAFAALMLWSFAEFLPRAGKFLTPAMRMPNWAYYSLALTGTIVLALIAATRVAAALAGRDPTEPYHERRDETGLPV
ncbi:C4-dicarboxylate ABC transporter substrate-binding protein [Acuticoccus sediminis]|uniref:TRAP transporter small permease protein n=1 Tax=Acuticoccus sediminis TaxID=2184697 RepID=A0A8B2NVF4_9HYPH|nr:TRAP transporter small permease subunit [Acuticoccus sediminis]RAI02298.1 C4-dicarboxylate ABC transporter substrate-binding protein [Acuticoccus sediminis]